MTRAGQAIAAGATASGGARYHLVQADASVMTVIAVKDSPITAIRSASSISRQRHGQPIAIWMLGAVVRPGRTIDAAGGALLTVVIGRRHAR